MQTTSQQEDTWQDFPGDPMVTHNPYGEAEWSGDEAKIERVESAADAYWSKAEAFGGRQS